MFEKYLKPIIASVVSLIIVAALAVGNVLCFANANVITSYICGQGFQDDTEEAEAARESGKVLAQQVEEEGAVLLKNNGVLPLKTKRVNVFGWSGSDDGFIVQGTGSGSGARNDLVTFLGGLKEAGIEYNENLAKAYDDLGWSRVEGGSYVIEAHGQKYKNFYGVTEAPESFHNDDRMATAREYSDTAIIVIGRLMGEGNDYDKIQYIAENSVQLSGNAGEDSSRKLQSLSAREEYMIEQVTKYFDNVILVTNTGNPIELGAADSDKIDAVLHMGYPGTRGAIGIGNILAGKVNPSGRLADTWAYDLSTAAAYETSGLDGTGSYTNLGYYYTEYLENIYTGYYWYETADKEGFWNTDFAKQRWNIKNGYEDVVQYPFGYGLSYTDFTWEIIKTNVKNGTSLEKDGTIEIEVMVTNTGKVAGKDVVELYYSAPYEKGGIEKSAIKLGAFAKTPEIEAGEFAIVTLTMDVEEMKSYDCYDANNNGIMGYELEKGDYVLSLRSDVHTLKEMDDGSNVITVKVDDDFYYEYDSTTGVKVENQFTAYTNTVSGASSSVNEPFQDIKLSIDGSENEGGAITYMTRSDFVTTFPRNSVKSKTNTQLKPTSYLLKDDSSVTTPKFGSKDTEYLLADLEGVDYDDDMWDDLVSQLSLETACNLITKSGGNSFGTMKIEQIGKERTVDADGPSGFNNNVIGKNDLKAVNYPCDTVIAQTWNWYVAYEVGAAIGIEGEALGIQGWFGPGANLHRSALGGRNFEYYSEDGLLAGTICAYHVLGAKKEGLLAYIKHIGANEDDTNRGYTFKWLTEQSLRENYLKPFEIAVKIGKANGLMGSVTRTASVRTTSSYALLTAVVRNEWGFRGTVITDYYGAPANDIDEGVRAGCTQVLHPDMNASAFDDKTTDTAKYYIHKAAKDILYAQASVSYYSKTAEDKVDTGIVGTRTTVDVFPWWIPVLITVDVLFVALGAFWVFISFKGVNKESAAPITEA